MLRMRLVKGFFRTCPHVKKVRQYPPHSGSELPPHSSSWTSATLCLVDGPGEGGAEEAGAGGGC